MVLARSSDSTARALLTEVRVLLRGAGVRRPREAESLAGGRGRRRRNQPWRRAALGVIRCSGSHSRHRPTKSRNNGSSQPLSAVERVLEPGGPRCLPLRDNPPLRTKVPSGMVMAVQYRGSPAHITTYMSVDLVFSQNLMFRWYEW